MKKLRYSGRKWLILRAANEIRRRYRRKVYSRPLSRFYEDQKERFFQRVQIWQGGEPEWAICVKKPSRPPQVLCFSKNLQDSVRFVEHLRTLSYNAMKGNHKLIDRSRGAKSPPRIGSYSDFSYPNYISTAAAVVLAAEYERMGKACSEITPTIDLDRWNGEVFRKLYQIGFFEIVGISPKRDDVVIDEGDTRTMQIIGTKNADDLGRVDIALQTLGAFVNPDGNIPVNRPRFAGGRLF